MKKYYIYHIPTFVHRNRKIGKIGCTEEPKKRVNDQGYKDYEILEEFTCIYLVSYREIALQKEYGYPVDTILYWKSVKDRESRSRGGKKGGKTQGPIQGKINVESGHLDRIRTKEGSIKGGQTQGPIQGRINAESGHLASICSIGGKTCSDMGFLAEARKIAIQKTSKPVLVYKKDGTFIGEFSSQQECARQLKICGRHITSVCNGKRKSVGGYVVKFKSTEDGI